MPRWLIIALVTLLPTSAFGDAVVLRDGTRLYGTVVDRTAYELTLKTTDRGVRTITRIPQDQIASVERGATAPNAETRPATRVASTAPATGPGTAPAKPVARESSFFRDLALSAIGRGRDSTASLSADQFQMWQSIIDAERTGKLDQQIIAMKTAAAAFAGEPTRLDALAEKEKGKRFGHWMAEVRWQLLAPRYKNGRFDLSDITPTEKADVIGILRGQTEPAIEPLRLYFPQPYRRGERPVNPVTGINASNAIVVKDRALFASAVLMAQLKLEPDMPTQDRLQLTTHLANVQRALRRATEYEGAAKAAIERAKRERRLTEERAARAARLNSASPRP